MVERWLGRQDLWFVIKTPSQATKCWENGRAEAALNARNRVSGGTEAGGTEFQGPRYEVEGELAAPDGRRPRIRTVWQIDTGQIVPRLITAYPVEVGS